MKLGRTHARFPALPRIFAAVLPLGAGCTPRFSGECNIQEQTGFSIPVNDLGAGVDDAGCAALCSSQYGDIGVLACSSELFPADGGGTLAVNCTLDTHLCVGGRRPAGFVGAAYSASDEVAGWLARASALEQASVPAFHILAAELRAHDAPVELIDACLRAAADEARHARAMSTLARRYRGVGAPVEVRARPPRSLVEIATENAIEGCVRERFGAFVAVLQAQGARDPHVRSVFAEIAPEELSHAALADAVDAWACGLLAPADRRRVAEAREVAHAHLSASTTDEPAEALRVLLGLPDATRTQALIAEMAG
jgi:hypothetical protein